MGIELYSFAETEGRKKGGTLFVCRDWGGGGGGEPYSFTETEGSLFIYRD